MKGLTVYQPWASAECLGLKGNETRSWPTKYRGPLALHAGVKWSALQEQVHSEIDAWFRAGKGARLPAVAGLPFGAVLAVCELADCMLVSEDNVASFSLFESSIAGDISPGRYVWVIDRVRPLRRVVPWRGAQGLWTVPAELLGLLDLAAKGESP